MSFDNTKDDEAVPESLREFGYAPGQPVLSAMRAVPIRPFAGNLPGATTASWQTRSAETKPQSLGIGHRIIRPELQQADSFQQTINGPKLAVGHRIMGITGGRPNAIPDPWRNQLEHAPYLNPQQSPPVQPLTNVSPFKADPNQHQGIFSSFVPAGATVNGNGSFTRGQSGFGSSHQGVRVGQPILSRSAPAERSAGFFASFANRPIPTFGSRLGTNNSQTSSVQVRSENLQNSSQIGQQTGQASSSTGGKQSTLQQHRQHQHHAGRLSRRSHNSQQPAAPPVPVPPVSDIQAYIRQQAAAYGIPEALALGLVNKESHFDPNLRGARHEVGLFQILPKKKPEHAEDANGKRFTIDVNRAASDWQYNVRAGMALLRRAYRKAQQSAPNDAIAATYAHYNGGDKNWIYYTRKNAPVHYHVYGQTILRHGKPIYVEGYMDFYRRWGGK